MTTVSPSRSGIARRRSFDLDPEFTDIRQYLTAEPDLRRLAIRIGDMREKGKRFVLFGGALLTVAFVALAATVWNPQTKAVSAIADQTSVRLDRGVSQTPVRVSGRRDVSALLHGRWRFATKKLVPKLINPHEVAALGTFEMPSGGGGECGMYPVKALAAMGPDDALVFVQVAGSGSRSREERLHRSRHRLPALRLTKVWWTSLAGGVWMMRSFNRRVGDRTLYLTVAFGGKPSASAKEEVEAIIGSLRF